MGSILKKSATLHKFNHTAPMSDHKKPGHPPLKTSGHAFSLVEVVIAMGIFSFAIVATFSLIGQSFKSYSSAINDTVSRQIMNQLAANAQQARLADLTNSPSYTLNFDNEGNPVSASDAMAVYTGNVTVTSPSSPFDSPNLRLVSIVVSPQNTNEARRTTLIVCPQN